MNFYICRRDPPKTPLELPSGGQSPCGKASLAGVLGAHLYQCTSWRYCERLHLTSMSSLQHVCPFHDWWFMSTPAHTELSVQQFLTKNDMISCAPPSLFTPSHPHWLFFLFPRKKKVLKGKCFADVEEVKQKMAEALKGIKIDEFKNCSE